MCMSNLARNCNGQSLFAKLLKQFDEKKSDSQLETYKKHSCRLDLVHEATSNPMFMDVIHANLHILNPADMYWSDLSMNPNAIHLLEKNPENIHWNFLSKNPRAVHLLEQNTDKIGWSSVFIAHNTHIFQYKYDVIKERLMTSFGEELVGWFYHIDNKRKWKDWGYDLDADVESDKLM